jgi:hypothetical protein
MPYVSIDLSLIKVKVKEKNISFFILNLFCQSTYLPLLSLPLCEDQD